jgi:hypothetical protein
MSWSRLFEFCVYNCIITHTPFPLFQVASLFPIAPATRPLSEHQESGQSDRGAPKCAHQSNPGLLGRARTPVRLNQNRNDRTARAGAGRTKLASQSEVAHATHLFVTEQSGINGARLYSEAIQENRGNAGRTGICTGNRGTFYRREVFYSVYL